VSVGLAILNRQRRLPVNTRQLCRLALEILNVMGAEEFELGVTLVDARSMAKINGDFLGHDGPTDVITFDYSNSRRAGRPGRVVGRLHGEIVICGDVVREHARRFDVAWQAELARYVIHGLLHLLGYDDTAALARRRMKREEQRLLDAVGRRFALSKLSRKTKMRL
jgi:probable rRNA maturation factor